MTLKELFNINISKFSSILYLIATLIIIIPISIVLVAEVRFSPMFSKMFLSTAVICIIIGKILTVLKKVKINKKDKSIPMNVGAIIGLLIVFLTNILK